jgi:hypothetical protein
MSFTTKNRIYLGTQAEHAPSESYWTQAKREDWTARCHTEFHARIRRSRLHHAKQLFTGPGEGVEFGFRKRKPIEDVTRWLVGEM